MEKEFTKQKEFINSTKKFRFISLSFLSIVLVSFITGCSSDNDNSNDSQIIQIEADLVKNDKDLSRYAGSDVRNLSFIDDDDIGLFLNGLNIGKWTLSNGSWVPETITMWPDTANVHNFHAFYPYIANSTFDNISSPSLINQDGSLANLYKHDLLIAKKTTSYKSANGLVSFTGTECGFKHVLSLLKINIIATGDLTNAVINSITINSPRLFSRVIYSFVNDSFRLDTETDIDEITISPNHSMNGVTKDFYIITNPKQTTADILITINYSTQTESNITKRAILSDNLLGKGLIYQYNILVRDGQIGVDTPSIEQWGNGNELSDIYI